MLYSKRVIRERKEKKERENRRGTHESKWQNHILHLYDIQEIYGHVNLIIWQDLGGSSRTYERIKNYIRQHTLIPTQNIKIDGDIKEYKFRLLIKSEEELRKHFPLIKMLRDRDKRINRKG